MVLTEYTDHSKNIYSFPPFITLFCSEPSTWPESSVQQGTKLIERVLNINCGDLIYCLGCAFSFGISVESSY